MKRSFLTGGACVGLVCLALGLPLLSCSESSTDPSLRAGSVTLSFREVVDGEPLAIGAFLNENVAGNVYAVDRLRYLVSSVRFHATDGTTVERAGVHFRDNLDPETQTFTLADLPGGSYTSVSFLLGLEEEVNAFGALGDSPELAAMRWPVELGDGYHFVWLEGRFRDAGSITPFSVRTGHLDDGTTDADYGVRVELPAMVVVDGGRRTVDVELNVNAWFDDPVYDFSEHETMVDDPDAQAMIRDNATNLLEPAILPQLEPVSFVLPGVFPATAPEPADNPTTRQGIQLGRMLFYDPILSGDSTLACAGCHRQRHAFGDPRRFSMGIDGQKGTRQAPTIVNPAWIGRLFWDGRAASLEEQALAPVENPIEMNADWDEVVERIRTHPAYPALFARVFGDEPITRDHVVKAIAQFERSFISGESRYDRYMRGEIAFTAQEERGWALFHTEDSECFHCHHPGGSELYTNNLFHNVGLDSMVVDEGRGGVTGNPNDIATFRTPTLRNVAVSAPYMHDGRFTTLEQVLEHYRTGGHPGTPNIDPLIRTNLGLPLTDQDVEDIIVFLHTLTDDGFLTNPDLSNPFE